MVRTSRHGLVLTATAAAPLLALLFTAYSLHRSQVDTRDLVVFGSYVLLGLVAPGVAMWRMLVSRGTWSLLADLACGVSLAYAVELGVYLICAHLDHPGVAFLWPVLPLAVSVLPRFRADVWRRAEVATPVWMPSLLSALAAYGVALLTRTNWDVYPIEGAPLRAPYVDTPYHLSLIGALSRHVPVDVPAVAGEPLYYHWFVHADLAAARHATGIEPLVLLTRLGPLVMALVVILGVAALAHRITGSWVAGAVAPALLCWAGGAALSRSFGSLFLTNYIFLSPTTIFAMALLIALIAVSLQLLAADARPARDQPGSWLVLIVTLGAISGAKGSLLPVLLGGYVSVIAMALLFERRLHRAGLAILAIGVAWFVIAQRLVYGGSSQGTEVEPFGIGRRVAANLGLAAPDRASLVLAAACTALYLGSRLTLWAPVAGLFTRDLWRDARAHFLVGGGVAALGAVVVFDSAAFNQVYFLLVAPPLIAISSAWGLVALVRRLPQAAVRPALTAGIATGIAIGYVCKELYGDTRRNQFTTARLLVPPAVAVLVCLAVAVLVAVLLGAGHRRLTTVLVASSAIASLGLPVSIAFAGQMIVTPGDQYRWDDYGGQPVIGIGGIAAARWVRDHSEPGDLVATNDHCLYAHRQGCDHRTTWVAAYTERQVLVEGWAYTSRSGDDALKQDVPASRVTFWDPRRLTDNDEAFSEPTAARIARLHDHYGVDWMVVDKRYPADVAALREYATQRYRAGQYVVFELS